MIRIFSSYFLIWERKLGSERLMAMFNADSTFWRQIVPGMDSALDAVAVLSPSIQNLAASVAAGIFTAKRTTAGESLNQIIRIVIQVQNSPTLAQLRHGFSMVTLQVMFFHTFARGGHGQCCPKHLRTFPHDHILIYLSSCL